MGKRGPKGKSPELESLQGFPGRRKAKTKAAVAATKSPPATNDDDIQDEPLDSCFVQPPAYLGKRERRVWVEIFSGPNARLWYKFSDHNVIARYCVMTVQWRQMTKTPPKPTYEVTQMVANGKDKPMIAGNTLIKRNPAFDQQLALSRELRSIESDVGLNPGSRLAMERQGLAGSKDPDPPSDKKTPGKPSGPVGILKSATKMN